MILQIVALLQPSVLHVLQILSGARQAHASMAGVAHILAQHRDASAKLVTLEQPVTVNTCIQLLFNLRFLIVLPNLFL